MILTVPGTDGAAKRLAARLENELISKEMNASDFARGIGRSQPTVWRWLNGEALPDHESVERIQKALGLRRGTVYRWAGLIDDEGLIDLDGIDGRARVSIRAILREYGESVPADGEHRTDHPG